MNSNNSNTRTRRKPTADAAAALLARHQALIAYEAASLRQLFAVNRAGGGSGETYVTLAIETWAALLDAGEERAARHCVRLIGAVWSTWQEAWAIRTQAINECYAAVLAGARRCALLDAEQAGLGLSEDDYERAISAVKLAAVGAIRGVMEAERLDGAGMSDDAWATAYTDALFAGVKAGDGLRDKGETRAAAVAEALVRKGWHNTNYCPWPVSKAGLARVAVLAADAARRVVRLEQRLDVFEIEAEALPA